MHLCIADVGEDGNWTVIEVLRSSIRLGEGWVQGCIPEEQIQKAISALSGFAAKAVLLDADVSIASATAAIREARNQAEFVVRFEETMGWPLRILGGIEEAAVVYRGTRPHLSGKILLFDLGGRSTELIYGHKATPEVCLTLPIGHLGLKAESPYSQPCTDTEWESLQATAMSWLGDVSEIASPPFQLASPSGAVRTLARMAASARGELTEGRGEGLSFNQNELRHQIRLLRQADRLQLRNIPGIDSRRSDTLLAAAALIQALMLRFSSTDILAAPGGLREGLLLEWADSLKER